MNELKCLVFTGLLLLRTTSKFVRKLILIISRLIDHVLRALKRSQSPQCMVALIGSSKKKPSLLLPKKYLLPSSNTLTIRYPMRLKAVSIGYTSDLDRLKLTNYVNSLLNYNFIRIVCINFHIKYRDENIFSSLSDLKILLTFYFTKMRSEKKLNV